MRNARVLRNRDICIFCATRQLAQGVLSSTVRPNIEQRRQLNSSSRDAQGAQLYRSQQSEQDDKDRERQALMARFGAQSSPSLNRTQTSQEDAERAALLARFGAPQPSQPNRGYPSQADRGRTRFGGQGAPQVARNARGKPQDTWGNHYPSNGGYDAGRGKHRANLDSRGMPPRGQDHGGNRSAPNGIYQPGPGRYRVNYESRGPPSALPEFSADVSSNWTHLKRKNDPPPTTDSGSIDDFLRSMEKTPPPRPKPEPRRKLDDDELQRLLGGASRRGRSGQAAEGRPGPSQYVRLAKDTRVETDSRETFPRTRDGTHDFAPARRQNPTAQEISAQAVEGESGDGFELAASAAFEGHVAPQVSQSQWVDTKQRAAETRERRGRIDRGLDAPALRQYEDRRKAGRRGGRMMRGDDEEMDEVVSRAEQKRLRREAKRRAQLEKAEPTPVHLPEFISVANLASILKIRAEEFVHKLEQLGFEDVKNDHILNAEHAGLIAQEYNYEPIIQGPEADEDIYPAPIPEDITSWPSRPPVVTIMGHVDHGKTTILDYLRKSSVVASEFGGITQHIGAFSVPLASGKTITFLDTPGHAAFLSMRQRGANVTDIVILVVAADDSVKPQTIEAIKHAQSAQVPIIVAINKIDKEQANTERVKQDLARHGIEVEDFGGDTQAVCVSGKTGQGISDLEDAVTLLSEVLDHRADPDGAVEGWVLEATTKKSGRVATVLVRRGTLRPGDVLVAGGTWTRVRTLKNEAGVAVKEVSPGMPVEVDGWREQPLAGDEVLQAPDEQKASAISELRQEKLEREQMAIDMEAINDSRRAEAERRAAEEAATAESAEAEVPQKESGPEIISFIVKADVSGSAEAVVDSIASIGNGEVGCRILRSGVGPPSEFDVQHAADAQGYIINFNTPIAPHISALAEEKGVQILDSNIIYRVVENVRALLSERLPPKIITRVTGEAEIAQVFEIGLGGRKKMKVAGTKVRNGVIERTSKIKVFREEKVIYDGTLSSLKSQKKDVDQMRKDTECGLAFDEWEDFAPGDKIQCYSETEEKRTL